MTRRLLASIVFAAVIAAVSFTSTIAQSQASASKSSQPARTPDGQPDMQGHWNLRSGKNTFEAYTLEGLPGSEDHQRIVGGRDRGKLDSIVVDPPDGRIPYQPWALTKRNEIAMLRLTPTKPEHLDPRVRCF